MAAQVDDWLMSDAAANAEQCWLLLCGRGHCELCSRPLVLGLVELVVAALGWWKCPELSCSGVAYLLPLGALNFDRALGLRPGPGPGVRTFRCLVPLALLALLARVSLAGFCL